MVNITGRQYLPGGGVQQTQIPYQVRPAIPQVINPAPTPTTSTPTGPTQLPTYQPGDPGAEAWWNTPEGKAQIAREMPGMRPDAPYSSYEVHDGYYWGVTPSGRQDRLNPSTQRMPVPESAVHGPGIYEPGREPIKPTVSQQNIFEGSGPGGKPTKAELRIFADVKASQIRAEYNQSIPSWYTQDYREAIGPAPNQYLLASEIFQQSLPSGPSQKYLDLVSQYNRQRYNILSSSGTLVPTDRGYSNISQGGEIFIPSVPVFTPGTTQGSVPQIPTYTIPQPEINPLLRSLLGVVELTPFGQFARSVWDIGTVIGMERVMGDLSTSLTEREQGYRQQGLIVDTPSGPTWTGSEQELNRYMVDIGKYQGIQSEYQRNIDAMFGGERPTPAGLVTYPIYEQLSGAGKWYTKNISPVISPPIDQFAKSDITQAIFTAGKISPLSPLQAPSMAFKSPENAAGFLKGFAVTGPPAFMEFGGMVPVGMEILARNPAAIAPMAAFGLKMQAEGTFEGLTKRPWEFAGENALMIAATYGVGKTIKTLTPVKYTGKIPFGEGGVNYRGVYAESPALSIKKLFGRAAEWQGVKNIGGITTSPKGTGILPQIKFSKGVPTHLTEYIAREGFTPQIGRSVVEVPLMRDLLSKRGAPGAVQMFDSQLYELGTLHQLKPTTIRDPYQQIEGVSFIKKGTGQEFLNTLRKASPEHKISGSFSQSVQSYRYPAVHDIDVYVRNTKQTAIKMSPYFEKYYPGQYRIKGSQIKIFKDNSWTTAMDILDIGENVGYMDYGIRTGKPIDINGIRITPLSEQLQRKVVASSMLRKTNEGWTTAPEFHRGKDIADSLGGIESQLIKYRLTGTKPPVELIKAQQHYTKQISKSSPLNEMINPRTGKTVPQEAQLRLGTYKTDTTPTVYSKVPGTNKYLDLGKQSVFEERFITPAFKKFGIGMRTEFIKTSSVKPFIETRYPKTIFKNEYPVFATTKPYSTIFKSMLPVKVNPITTYNKATPQKPQKQVIENLYSKPSRDNKQTFELYYGISQKPGKAPSIYLGLETIYPEGSPYPGTKINSLPWYPPEKPVISLDKYLPVKKKTTVYPTTIYPKTTKPVQSSRYPSTVPPTRYPSTVPPTRYPPTVPPTKTPPSVPPFTPPNKPPTTPPTKTPPIVPPTKPPTSPPPFFPPPRKTFLIKEEKNQKTKLKLHMDALASKWNIRSPIPRLSSTVGYGTGKQLKDELKIYNKQYSRKKGEMIYQKHLPYEVYTSLKVK